MLAPPELWEHGSEFHDVPFTPARGRQRGPWSDGVLLGSGRDALRLVAEHGAATRGWRRLWVPSFLCQEVVASLRDAGPVLAVYPDDPRASTTTAPDARPGDAVLHVNYFGLRPGPSLRLPRDVDVIEDHTHDPLSHWATESTADFCVVSLRKTLPVPDGGALWSPRGHVLPAGRPVTETRRSASSSKLAAMLLKRLYLDGHPVRKEAFRSMAVEGEEGIARGAISGMTDATQELLETFPLAAWRERRRANHDRLATRLESHRWLSVLRPFEESCVPFSVVVVVDHPERRQRIRSHLIERRVYPAVLWPLEETVLPVPEEARDLGRRVLSLHCDMRYQNDDLDLVAELVDQAGKR